MVLSAKFSFSDYSMTKEGLTRLTHAVTAMAAEKA